MLENGTIREDMHLPSGTEDYDKLAELLQEEVEAGKDVQVTVLKVWARARAAEGVCFVSWGGQAQQEQSWGLLLRELQEMKR